MNPGTVLIIDAGARGDEISFAYEACNEIEKIVVAPGNDLITYRRRMNVVIEKNCRRKM